MVNKWVLTQFTFRIWVSIFPLKIAFKSTAVLVPQKVKQRTAICPSNSTSGDIPKRIQSRYFKRYLYTHVHSSIIHNSQKVETSQQPKCPLTDDGTNQMWYIHKVAYYSPSRVILTHATAWIHLEDIILSEVSQTQLYCKSPLLWCT